MRARALPAALLEKLKRGVLSLLVNTQGARTMREKSDELVERAAAKDDWQKTVSVSRAKADGWCTRISRQQVTQLDNQSTPAKN